MKKLLTRKKKGFTLIELIVVMAVIGILVLLATPRFLGYTKDADVTAMLSDVKVLSNASLLHNIDTEKFPFVDANNDQVADPVELTTLDAGLKARLVLLGFNDETATKEGEDTIAKLDSNKLNPYVKNIKGDYDDYVLVTSGALEGEVFHATGISDKEGTLQYGVK